MSIDQILNELKQSANPENVAGMAHFGINPETCLGISTPFLEKIAKKIGKHAEIAEGLWNSGVHEARILSVMVEPTETYTEETADTRINDVNSWDLCDQFMNRLLRKTGFARKKALEWSARTETFVKRAGFVLMAQIAVHDKNADDASFDKFFAIIKREAGDQRNFVKKAVNWALRQIGKRNMALNQKALEAAREIQQLPSKSAAWIANNAVRELTNEKILNRLRSKA